MCVSQEERKYIFITKGYKVLKDTFCKKCFRLES